MLLTREQEGKGSGRTNSLGALTAFSSFQWDVGVEPLDSFFVEV
jgi:hypothetical protein